MQRACIQWGGAAAAAVFALLLATPLRAADNSAMRPVAEELGQRTKPAAAPEGEQKRRAQRQRRPRADDLRAVDHPRQLYRARRQADQDRQERPEQIRHSRRRCAPHRSRGYALGLRRSLRSEGPRARELPDADEERGGEEGLEQGPDASDQRAPYVLGLLFHRQHQDHHHRRSPKAPRPSRLRRARAPPQSPRTGSPPRRRTRPAPRPRSSPRSGRPARPSRRSR